MGALPAISRQADQPGGTGVGRSDDAPQDDSLVSLVAELSNAAMALATYVEAAVHLRSKGDAGRDDKIDAALRAAQQQADRLRQAILSLRAAVDRRGTDR